MKSDGFGNRILLSSVPEIAPRPTKSAILSHDFGDFAGLSRRYCQAEDRL